MVHFVGAGPGAVDLITVRGMKLIESADVIIYAGSLVNPELLKYAGENCEIHDSAYMTLEEVLDVIIHAEKTGKMTVRLHTGDGAIYGAIKEQMDELNKHGISYDVCPGVSSFLGAAASLKMEYTLPSVSQSVIITRAEGRTAVPERENLKSYASHHATMVLFLSSSLAEKVKCELIKGGYESDTPVAVVYKATWPDEKIIRTTLNELPEAMKKESITKTALIIVGHVLGSTYEKSKLYDAEFSTEFRKAKSSKRTYAIIVCSKKAYDLGINLKEKMLQTDMDAEISIVVKTTSVPEEFDKAPLDELIVNQYSSANGIIFISAAGIAVRSVTKLIKHKSIDPAVVVMDENAENCISLLSGHAGGANQLAKEVAKLCGANAIITTATDCENRFAVDEFARTHNLILKDWKKAKEISVRILNDEKIYLTSVVPMNLPDDKQVQRMVKTEVKTDFRIDSEKIDILIDYRQYSDEKFLQLIPRCIVAGIGCKKNTPKEKIEEAVKMALHENHIQAEALFKIVSIDLKANEPGLLELVHENDYEFQTFSAEELLSLEGEFTTSEFVQEITGVDNVCERSVAMTGAKIISRKMCNDGVTVALGLNKSFS